uniref:ABC transporter permease n=1 Tax=candidate division WOR-3 bacterium TaxID=2052148 RepID=A0A7V3ZX95_UNCW3
MMKRLIWKELRENFINALIFVGVILTVTVYGVVKNIENVKSLAFISLLIVFLSFLMVFSYAIYRGFSSIKREKDRNTLEFLLSLPIDGREIVTSKFLAFAIESLFLWVCVVLFSHIPILFLRLSNAIGGAEFISGMKTITYLAFHFFLFTLFTFVVLQFYEILVLSLKTKNFFVNAVIFFVYLYLVSEISAAFKKIFSFIPGEAPHFGNFLGETITIGGSTTYQGLAAGALTGVALIVCGILLFNKKVEV